MSRQIALFLLLVTGLFSVQAADHDAHVHGLVEVSVLAEEQKVEVTIDSPLMNLVGFEHTPHTDEQIAALLEVKRIFNEWNSWLNFSNNNCRLVEKTVEIEVTAGMLSQHGEESHSEYHNDEASHSGHQDMAAHYQFLCQQLPLKTLDINLQASFPRIEEVHIEWLVNDKAGIRVLEGSARQVSFE